MIFLRGLNSWTCVKVLRWIWLSNCLPKQDCYVGWKCVEINFVSLELEKIVWCILSYDRSGNFWIDLSNRIWQHFGCKTKVSLRKLTYTFFTPFVCFCDKFYWLIQFFGICWWRVTDSRLHICIWLTNSLYDFIEILRSELHHYLMDITIIASLVSIDHFEDASGLSRFRVEMHCGTVWGDEFWPSFHCSLVIVNYQSDSIHTIAP